jgi:hypothetical protein
LIQAISLDGVLAKDLAPVSVQQVLRGAVDDIDPLPVACREFQHRPVSAEKHPIHAEAVDRVINEGQHLVLAPCRMIGLR